MDWVMDWVMDWGAVIIAVYLLYAIIAIWWAYRSMRPMTTRQELIIRKILTEEWSNHDTK